MMSLHSPQQPVQVSFCLFVCSTQQDQQVMVQANIVTLSGINCLLFAQLSSNFYQTSAASDFSPAILDYGRVLFQQYWFTVHDLQITRVAKYNNH